jgi:hypothetical protein
MTVSLPDNNKKINIKNFLLDPLSVIIKLAILGNKPVGTKILIQNNVIYFQEPGMFQSFIRIIYNTNKTDLQYMYNPIQIACTHFLSEDMINGDPRIRTLFISAQKGLTKLMETYNNGSIINLCLNYYYAIITNNLYEKNNNQIFYGDSMSEYYTEEFVEVLNDRWTQDKIKIVLDLICFLTNDVTSNNVKSLETIMENNDLKTQKFFSK